MNRAAIRQAVDARLSDLGYSPGWYKWHKPGHLRIWSGKGGKFTELHLPAGKTSRRALANALDALVRVGAPRAAPAMMKDDGWVQTDWGDAR